jgi:Flp pilus assembly protein TadG
MHFPSPIRFLADRRGNIAMMYALMLPVLLFGVGMAIDYTHAMQVKTKLDAAADAAALAGLTPNMMQQTGDTGNAAAKVAVTNLFTAMANAQSSLVAGKTVVTVNVCNPATLCAAGQRVVTVSYTAANTNIFAGILGVSAIGIAGSATASASAAPNIDFYLLLDNSPSMALPATQDGINSMIALTTPGQTDDTGYTGCAFACHQASVGNADTAGNAYWNPNKTSQTCTGAPSGKKNDPNAGCVQMDNYQVAKANNITLRIDNLNNAVTTLMATAQATTTSSPQVPPPAYRFAAYAMDSTYAVGLTKVMGLTKDYVTGWSAASPGFKLMEVYSNNYECATSGSDPCGAQGTHANDTETNFDTALNSSNMNSKSYMPNPGTGTNTNGDTPQEVLFIVTDGVVDEVNSSTCTQSLSGSRCQEPITKSLCDAIKNRSTPPIRIAVLYTTYLAVTNDGWYNQWVKPFQSKIATQLQACASPGLYYEATIGQDLGQALTSLFNTVRNTARLTN